MGPKKLPIKKQIKNFMAFLARNYHWIILKFFFHRLAGH